MGLLERLLSLLGRDDGRSSDRRTETGDDEDGATGGDGQPGGVAVERQPTGTGTAAGSEAETEDADATTADTASGTDGSSTDTAATAEPPAEAPADHEEAPDPEPPGGDEPPTVVKGIGPSYGERLAEAGIETVADLAAAEPEQVAAETGLSPKRVGRWVERARERN